MEKKKSRKENTERKRNFASIVYPESAPENWKAILDDFHVPSFISPLHDKDVNPDGEIKKAHYHVMLMFDGNKSESQVEEIFKAIGAVGRESVISKRGYARYLCHLDNPEKYQYNIGEVTCLGGVDYLELIDVVLDKYTAIDEMIEFCDLHDIYSYAILLNYCRKERKDWFRVLCDNGTYVMKAYLKSKDWTDKQAIKDSLIFG